MSEGSLAILGHGDRGLSVKALHEAKSRCTELWVGFDMSAMLLRRRLKKPAAEVPNPATLACVEVDVLPIGYRFAGVGPDGPRESAQLMVVDRYSHPVHGERESRLLQLRLVVDRIDPEDV